MDVGDELVGWDVVDCGVVAAADDDPADVAALDAVPVVDELVPELVEHPASATAPATAIAMASSLGGATVSSSGVGTSYRVPGVRWWPRPGGGAEDPGVTDHARQTSSPHAPGAPTGHIPTRGVTAEVGHRLCSPGPALRGHWLPARITLPPTTACRRPMAAAYTCKILTARAAIRSTATTETADSSAISALIFLVRGIASVGLKAIELVIARYR